MVFIYILDSLYVSNAKIPMGTINFSASNEATIRKSIWSGVMFSPYFVVELPKDAVVNIPPHR
jgi:hypothetical protein